MAYACSLQLIDSALKMESCIPSKLSVHLVHSLYRKNSLQFRLENRDSIVKFYSWNAYTATHCKMCSWNCNMYMPGPSSVVLNLPKHFSDRPIHNVQSETINLTSIIYLWVVLNMPKLRRAWEWFDLRINKIIDASNKCPLLFINCEVFLRLI